MADEPLTVGHMVRKVGVVARVTEEMLGRELIADRLLGRKPRREWTEEERAAHEARLAQERAETEAAAVALAGLRDPFARAVLDLHKPTGGPYLVSCEGCDYNGFDGEPADYPCRTVTLVAEHYGVPMPKTWRV